MDQYVACQDNKTACCPSVSKPQCAQYGGIWDPSKACCSKYTIRTASTCSMQPGGRGCPIDPFACKPGHDWACTQPNQCGNETFCCPEYLQNTCEQKQCQGSYDETKNCCVVKNVPCAFSPCRNVD